MSHHGCRSWPAGALKRARGIVHTVKDGIVIENARLMEEVTRIVAESKRGACPDVATHPFVTDLPPGGPGPAAEPGGRPQWL